MNQPKKAKKWLLPVLGASCLAVGLLCYALDIPHIRVEQGDGQIAIIIGESTAQEKNSAPAQDLLTEDAASNATDETSNDALLGLAVRDLSVPARVFYHLPPGPCVTGVDPHSDCGRKGIREGDIITALAGQSVETVAELVFVRNQFSAGDTISMHIFRAGELREFSVRLGTVKGKEQ